MSGRRPDAAGILSALGQHRRARTLRVARAMNDSGSWVTIAWPSRVRRPRPCARTGLDWRTQERDEGGRWSPGRVA
jgi:hypothetical protein